ncbi:toxin-antitoxin system YwqK family antitoxin [Candidatus Riflebacteria bacterium]
MPKKHVTLFCGLFFLLLVSSFAEDENKVAKREEPFKKMQRKKGLVFIKNEKEPFSGILFNKYPDSGFRLKSEFVKGEAEGKHLKWYKTGALKMEFNRKNGKLDGVQKLYYDDGKTPAYTREYRDGVFIENSKPFTGVKVTYYRNGEIWYVTEFRSGLRHGLYAELNKNGGIISASEFTEGKYKGRAKRVTRAIETIRNIGPAMSKSMQRLIPEK